MGNMEKGDLKAVKGIDLKCPHHTQKRRLHEGKEVRVREVSLQTKLVEVMEFQLSYFKS